ncbi:hypothetical protein DZF91_30725 [Actinomadura logoneensis]|uniref:Cellulose synthase n=1 Tax=Actinomadura logoneensis TaxID=2293572 RepID=A0A372JD11_9ACTN|nr:hypothetical protein [Actinomadura logoneensis]RFU37850.1 hypothetical protein DZF91_30725 [Actinomadura logoneensis]
MSDAVIFAISLGVTLVGLVASWGVYRRRGAASGARGAALSLIPLAAAMTGVTSFLSDLVFSPMKWAGVAVAGLAVVLYLASGAALSRRSVTEGDGSKAARKAARDRGTGAGKAPKGAVGGGAPTAADPDLAEIEDILRNRGIK